MSLKLITAPTDTPLTTSEIKKQLKIDFADDDALLDRYNLAATAHFDGDDGILGRALEEQTWDLIYDAFPATEIKIPLPPLISVDAIYYYDADGIEQTLSSGEYEVDLTSPEGWVVAGENGWPTIMQTINAVRIRFTAGYERTGSPPETNVPEPIRQAIALTVGHWYRNREAVVIGDSTNPLPIGVMDLVQTFKIFR